LRTHQFYREQAIHLFLQFSQNNQYRAEAVVQIIHLKLRSTVFVAADFVILELYLLVNNQKQLGKLQAVTSSNFQIDLLDRCRCRLKQPH
jgi:hypothetical protein